MKKIVLGLLIMLGVLNIQAQDVTEITEDVAANTQEIVHVDWQNSFKDAVRKAKAENKPVLIFFTGSDWCGPCMRIDEHLFHTQKFADYSKENLVLYTANFPRNRDLVSADTKKVNKELSKKYSQTSFPTMIVIDAKGNVLGRKNGSYLPEYYYPFFEEMVRIHK